MLQVRGIILDYPHNTQRIKILVAGDTRNDYEWLVFPPTLPLNKGQIRKFLGDHFDIPPGEIAWPPHVKIPGE